MVCYLTDTGSLCPVYVLPHLQKPEHINGGFPKEIHTFFVSAYCMHIFSKYVWWIPSGLAQLIFLTKPCLPYQLLQARKEGPSNVQKGKHDK
jgi:hypothetical protein